MGLTPNSLNSIQQSGMLASLCLQMVPPEDQSPRRFKISTSQAVAGAEYFEDVEPKFNVLVEEWKRTRHATSHASAMATNLAYLGIIGMGPKVLPFILRELSRHVDHWFIALQAIAGENPVPAASRGNLPAMSQAWLNWGREKGYVR